MGYVPRIVLSAEASPDDWPEKGLHIGGQKAERHAVRLKSDSIELQLQLRFAHGAM